MDLDLSFRNYFAIAERIETINGYEGKRKKMVFSSNLIPISLVAYINF